MSAKSMAPALRKALLVDLEELHRLAGTSSSGSICGGEAGGVEQALLGAADNVEDVGLLVPPHLARAEDVPLLRRVPELEIGRKPGDLRVAAQMPEREAVKGRDRQVPGRTGDRAPRRCAPSSRRRPSW